MKEYSSAYRNILLTLSKHVVEGHNRTMIECIIEDCAVIVEQVKGYASTVPSITQISAIQRSNCPDGEEGRSTPGIPGYRGEGVAFRVLNFIWDSYFHSSNYLIMTFAVQKISWNST
ncbi:hypothetical protein LOAG_07164 [Loa loa]|uniref:Uncharacterized protein n=1 Tax=Loa loa TaxID=7209 RepID=A0A1S0TW65_LOALO|nr:hypothetical protein LOAG_07164 [Loa loa]EFO21322.1 hypothetical protein LOAG_07164 [Loa loa]